MFSLVSEFREVRVCGFSVYYSIWYRMVVSDFSEFFKRGIISSVFCRNLLREEVVLGS